MAAPYAPPMPRSRPFGVAILAVLIGLVAVLLLVVSIALILLFSGLAIATEFSFFGAGAIGGVILLIFSIVLLVVAVGLWRLEMWALVLSFLVLFILVVSNVVRGNIVSFSTIFDVLLLVYLFLVRHHFR